MSQEDGGQRSIVSCQDMWRKRLEFVFTSCTVPRKEKNKNEKER